MTTDPPTGPSASGDELRQWFADSFGIDLRTASPAEIVGLLEGVGQRSNESWWQPPVEPLELAEPPSEPLRYTMKVTLDGSKPPIWRRIAVPSDIMLDEFHHVLQAAMGWTNSHLHQFTPGHDRLGQRTEKILTDFDLSEGDEGVEESTIRLDALLTEPGDKLHYWYDFGDSWHHTIVLEKTEPRAPDDDTAACLAGRRACPPEDIGGIHFYSRLFDAAEDADDPEHEWAREVVEGWRLSREAAAAFDVEHHDEEVRRAMVGDKALRRMLEDPEAYPAAITDLFEGLGYDAARYVAGIVDSASVEEPVSIERDDALAATAVIRTFLDHVGDDGLELTSAGYLKPVSVQALMAELDPDQKWIGASNREAQTQPLLMAREVITGMGLVRKLRGRLLLTKAGARLKDDPVGLWWHVARRLPVERPDEGRDAATFLLLHLASGGRVDDAMHEQLDLFMAIRGWQTSGTSWPGVGRWQPFIRRTRAVLGWATTGRVFTMTSGIYDSPAARLLARGAMATTRRS